MLFGMDLMRLALAAPLSCGLLFLAFAGPVTAGPAEVLKCTEIADGSARLACFDQAVPSLRNTPMPPVAAAPPAPPMPPEQRFGAARMENREIPPELAEPDSISATLVGVSQVAPNRWSFTLDNGQVWRQTVSRDLGNIKTGRPVTVEKAVLGSYTMKIEGVAGIIKVARSR